MVWWCNSDVAWNLYLYEIMFLTNPTSDELRSLDRDTLTQMLNIQTMAYTELLNEEGLSARAQAQKELVIRIQEAIESGKQKI